MKPEKQRIAIAEECGWTMSLGFRPIDYFNDRNAIIEAVRSLPKDKLCKVLEFLQIIVTNDHRNFMNEKALATAEQWSEAFLRGVGRWQE